MAKVTSKCQVTIPKAVAVEFGIRPGMELEWIPTGKVIRVIPLHHSSRDPVSAVSGRLKLFDQATARLRSLRKQPSRRPRKRGWTREEIYRRDGAH
jgi:AbrB family looped-hinge helix DNA binding protein